MPDLDRLPLAFDRRDTAGLGWTRHAHRSVVGRAEVEQVAPGIHAEAVRWALASPVDRLRALAQIAPRRFEHTALSHVSAVAWHGLPHPRWVPAAVHLTVDRGHRVSQESPWVELYRCATPAHHVEIVDGVPVTTMARTVIDCMRTVPPGDAVAIADAAVRSGVPLGALVDVRKHQSRWPGVRKARRWLGVVDGRRESWLESASAVAFDKALLALPFPQVDVHDRAGRFVARVDGYWPHLQVAGEADGDGKFLGDFDGDRSPEATSRRWLAAQQRADRLRALGIGVARWGVHDLATPPSLRLLVEAARSTRPLRARLTCATCHGALEECRCVSRLCMADGAQQAG